MALRERAALAVLAGQTNRMPLPQQCTEGERLGGRPIDVLTGLDHLATIVEEAADGAMDIETIRHRRQLLADLDEFLLRHGGHAAAWILLVAGLLKAGPLAVKPVGLVGLVGLADLKFRVEFGAE